MKVRAHQYDTVDALCWRHYGRALCLMSVIRTMTPRRQA
ncbi:hypothetical protein J7Y97_001127 [Salmonella enterica]|nr:hypothetical protein [Salmonella enterica]